jgi:hypothetical protein
MTTGPESDLSLLHPRSPAFGYAALCGASLAVTVLVLMQQGLNLLVTMLILLVGILGLVTRMKLAPLLLVVLVAVCQIIQQFYWVDFRSRMEMPMGAAFRVGDALIGAAVLGFVAGHYRLQGLSRHLFPPDQRFYYLRRHIKVPASLLRALVERRRSPQLVTPAELALLVVSLPAWALAAQVAWLWLARPRDVLEWDAWLARLTVLLVVMIGGLVAAAAVLRHLRRHRMTLDEATLVLQDTLWNETRGEQRWYTRWLAWFWLRRKEQEQP